MIGLTAPLLSQGISRLGGRLGPPLAPTDLAKQPVKKLPDGSIDLSGVWTDGGGNAPAKIVDSLILPWAVKVRATRKEAENPYFACMPAGPLRLSGGMAWRFVQPIEATHLFWLYEGNIHTYRQFFMDGRPHPPDPTPGFYGHSIGKWEGDTLVVDTVGLNDKWWFDTRGTPHTEQLHLIERWTRTNFTTLRRVITVDDPGTFSKPFDYEMTARLSKPGSEIMEYFCQENNQYMDGLTGKP
jgi:hypothetical protein